MPIDIYLHQCPDYSEPELGRAISSLFDSAGFSVRPGTRVLVKPNLVSPRQASLACTHPAFVAAACRLLKDMGAKITVADSPAFGTAGAVGRACKMVRALNPLGIRLETLGRPVKIPLTLGGEISVSATALEAEQILNLAKLKAHCQMRVTCGVKNMFGCVCGFRKAYAHTTLGREPVKFASMIMDVFQSLPRMATLVDAATAMHVIGPTGGKPYSLGLAAFSENTVALDTAMYQNLGLEPKDVFLWQEAVNRKLPGHAYVDLRFPMAGPNKFNFAGFELPGELDPVEFRPVRFIRGRIKSLLHRLG